ncbi:protein BCP1 protein [Dioscorea alata]|uniref:Protein BCP1 protein n=3 Tax=Dioscorea alata TaxID=55571 RepID=A0ACB7WHJ9_DIOAL|nr:protein BCP1 protein [Dioscorea alata]KAH7687226.1 protein BCP1 protein [Dioscorea alata]KAH7687227.1 protein BCP1 protein [Dioscorea alata]
MNHRRPSKRRRHSRLQRPQPFLGFSPFARSLFLTSSCSSSNRHSRDRSLSHLPSESNPKHAVCKHPTPTKRPSSVSDDDEDNEVNEKESGAEQEMEIIQADFGFFDPKPGDFGGVKLLLQNYLDNKPWDLSGFVDLILEQTTVGTVVKSDGGDDQGDEENDDEDDVYAVISALNLGRYAEHECIHELKKFLLEACGDENVKKKLRTLLEKQANEVGLLVSQRFVNCPHQLVPPLYDALFDEVSWATEDEPTQELRDSFRFKCYLLVTRIYMRKKVDQQKTVTSPDCNEAVVYIKAEDEIFQELSSFSFTFRLHNEQLVPYELRNYNLIGLVMVVKAEAVPKFRERLKSLLAES